jgi:hypothetical protein
MTGRAAGFCVGSGMPGSANPLPGRGFGGGFGRGRGGGGWGRGGGRGWWNQVQAAGLADRARSGGTVSPAGLPASRSLEARESDLRDLRGRADALRRELDLVNAHLAALEAGRLGDGEGASR